jgi:hypothetical protein
MARGLSRVKGAHPPIPSTPRRQTTDPCNKADRSDIPIRKGLPSRRRGSARNCRWDPHKIPVHGTHTDSAPLCLSAFFLRATSSATLGPRPWSPKSPRRWIDDHRQGCLGATILWRVLKRGPISEVTPPLRDRLHSECGVGFANNSPRPDARPGHKRSFDGRPRGSPRHPVVEDLSHP